MLSQKQVEQYRYDGYLFPFPALSAAELAECNAGLARFERWLGQSVNQGDFRWRSASYVVLHAKIHAMQRIDDMRRRLLKVSAELASANRALERMSRQDWLTELANRRGESHGPTRAETTGMSPANSNALSPDHPGRREQTRVQPRAGRRDRRCHPRCRHRRCRRHLRQPR